MSLSAGVIARFGDYVIRQATANDYQAVMDINNNVFDGLDYLPAMYYQFLQSKRDLMLVIEDRDGPMFLSILGFDDEDPTTICVMGGRISPAKRNKGIYRNDVRAILQQFLLQHFSQATTAVYVTNMTYLKPGIHESLYRMTCIGCSTSTDIIRNGLGQQIQTATTVQYPRKISFQQIDYILKHSSQLEQFFSRYAVDYIVGLGNWRPIKIHGKHDLRGMFAAASAILFTTEDGDSTGSTNGLENAPLATTSKIISMSYSFALPVKAGLAYSIVFFGDDPSLIRQHELEQVKHLTTVYKGNVFVDMAFPHKMTPDEVLSNVATSIGKHEHFPNFSNVVARNQVHIESKL